MDDEQSAFINVSILTKGYFYGSQTRYDQYPA